MCKLSVHERLQVKNGKLELILIVGVIKMVNKRAMNLKKKLLKGGGQPRNLGYTALPFELRDNCRCRL